MQISFFEMAFFVFVSCAWPVSIYRMLHRKSTGGKSLFFSFIIFIGYVFGIIHKFLYDLDPVVYFYFLALVLVSVDMIVFLYVRSKYGKGAAS